MDRYVKSSRITMQSSYLYSPILSHSQELKEPFLWLTLRQGPSLLYYRPRLTNHGQWNGDPGSCAAESGTPCEKKPRLLPSSRSFAGEERTPAGTPHIYYTRKGRVSANAMENGDPATQLVTRARGKGILNTWLPASKDSMENGE